MFAALDWKSPEFTTYLAIGGAAVVALSVVLYAVPGKALKVPGIVLSIVGALGAGLALGVILMGAMGYHLNPPERDESGNPPPGGRGGPPGGGMPGGMAGMGGGRGGGMGGGGGGGRGPNYKGQLTSLVTKLDVLTEKPLTVSLTPEQRKEVNEQLKGLSDEEKLSDDDAKEKLDKLQKVLETQKGTLEEAGYRWQTEGGGGRPGGGGGRPGGGGQQPPPPENPFKTEQNGKHLKALTERLEKETKG